MSGILERKALIVYWLLLLIPTVAIGAAALRLLTHEEERLEQLQRAAIQERADVVAADIALAVDEVKAEFMAHLLAIPEESLRDGLRMWQQTAPLVRNVFIWRPGERVVLPNPDRPATAEEGRFLRRYELLFSGAVSLVPATPDTGLDEASSSNAYLTNRIQLQRSTAPIIDRTLGDRDWLTWYSDNSLFLLGWTRPAPDAPVRGVEIESMALLSHLISVLPTGVPENTAFALLDGSGNVLHQTGAISVDDTSRQLVRTPIGPALPHWEIVVYTSNGPGGNRSAFLVVAGLLVGASVFVILAAGTLLLREAHRGQVEAMQKTSFVSNVSHELKTPLTSIRMYAELLGEDRVSDAGKRRRYLRTIVDESQRLSRLIGNVLDFSRLEQGRKSYEMTDVDVVDVVERVLENQAVRLHEAGMRVEKDLGEERLIARTDRDALEQVLVNLVDNSVKYAAGGEELRVELAVDEHGVRIAVMDRGPGVAAGQREKVFDTFHRTDDSLTSRLPGTGLGLTIARRLMRGMGGDVVCGPRKGGGAVFEVTLNMSRTES